MQTWTLNDIAQLVGGAVRGDANLDIDGLATLKNATATQLSFLANPLYGAALATTEAGAVLLRPEDAVTYLGNALIVASPYAAYAQLTHHFDRTPKPVAGHHPQAVISALAIIDANCQYWCLCGDSGRCRDWCRFDY